MSEETLVAVTIELEPEEIERLRPAASAALAMARDELIRTHPMEAGLIAWLGGIADDVRIAAAASRAEPKPAPTKKGAPVPAPKIKHTFGSNGVCTVKHDGKTPCSVTRTRKPRAGSRAAAEAEAAARTEPLPEVDPRQTTIPGSEGDGQA